ncbi:MAG: hypothetical protein KBC36_13315 [Spirochaetia bacterium]|nr:hypothetical protein [Spirochaetia bacterium]
MRRSSMLIAASASLAVLLASCGSIAAAPESRAATAPKASAAAGFDYAAYLEPSGAFAPVDFAALARAKLPVKVGAAVTLAAVATNEPFTQGEPMAAPESGEEFVYYRDGIADVYRWDGRALARVASFRASGPVVRQGAFWFVATKSGIEVYDEAGKRAGSAPGALYVLWHSKLIASDRYLFFSSYGDGAYTAYDISDPRKPASLGAYKLPGSIKVLVEADGVLHGFGEDYDLKTFRFTLVRGADGKPDLKVHASFDGAVEQAQVRLGTVFFQGRIGRQAGLFASPAEAFPASAKRIAEGNLLNRFALSGNAVITLLSEDVPTTYVGKTPVYHPPKLRIASFDSATFKLLSTVPVPPELYQTFSGYCRIFPGDAGRFGVFPTWNEPVVFDGASGKLVARAVFPTFGSPDVLEAWDGRVILGDVKYLHVDSRGGASSVFGEAESRKPVVQAFQAFAAARIGGLVYASAQGSLLVLSTEGGALSLLRDLPFADPNEHIRSMEPFGGKYLLSAASYLRIWDVSDPAKPVEWARMAMKVTDNKAVALDDKYVLDADYTGKLTLWEIGPERGFRLLDEQKLPERLTYVYPMDGHEAVIPGIGLAGVKDGKIAVANPLPEGYKPLAGHPSGTLLVASGPGQASAVPKLYFFARSGDGAWRLADTIKVPGTRVPIFEGDLLYLAPSSGILSLLVFDVSALLPGR